MMVDIPTQKRSGLSIGGGYTSFPRTTPSRSLDSHESSEKHNISTTSWFSCTSTNNVHNNKPDPIETGDDGYKIHTKLTARGRSLKQKHQTNNNTEQPNHNMIETSKLHL